jgi:hypothetical protein
MVAPLNRNLAGETIQPVRDGLVAHCALNSVVARRLLPVIASYDGTPTGFGQGFRDHLGAVNP